MATPKSGKIVPKETVRAVSKNYSLCTRQPLKSKEVAKIYQTLRTEKNSKVQF